MYQVFAGNELKNTFSSIEDAQAEAAKLAAEGLKDVAVVIPE